MKEKIKKFKEEYFPFKYNRIRHHFRILDSSLNITNKSDNIILGDLERVTNNIIKKIKFYGRFNTFFYSMIYFSFFSMFFNDFLFLSELKEMIGLIIGFLGTTVFLVAVQFTNKIIELFYQDLSLISSHRMIIYAKYQKEVSEENSLEFEKSHNVFLEYFKKRYGN